MIVLKTHSELEQMVKACRISADALNVAEEMIKPGVTTKEIDRAMHDYIVKCGAKPSFLGLYGFPASACISVNDVVIHGIPSGYRLQPGDIVSVDVGAMIDGYHGDNAYTFAVGEIPADVAELLRVTKESLYKGIEAAVVGNRIGDISYAVQSWRYALRLRNRPAIWSVTAWAESFTRIRKSRTSGVREEAPALPKE